jgi:hypothetical protein
MYRKIKMLNESFWQDAQRFFNFQTGLSKKVRPISSQTCLTMLNVKFIILNFDFVYIECKDTTYCKSEN